MRRIFSGIQPTGTTHLGNYVGALRQWADQQREFDAFYCVVDLHAITQLHDPAVLTETTLEVAALLLACGLDPGVCTMFVQSHVTAHAELAWLLNNVATVGELRRMTQFKAKSGEASDRTILAGLLNYPVLMAADILLYQTDRVPIGEDQRQHLELTRDIAGRFNQRFGQTFTMPEAHIPAVGARVMDLQDPTKKMSKSTSAPAGRIHLLDPPAVIAKKVRTAVTDSGREIVVRPDKPAVSNLLELLSVATGKQVPELEAAYAGKGYGQLKQDLADALVAFLAPVRECYTEIRADDAALAEVLEVGADKARSVAAETMDLARERMGFLAPRVTG